MSDIHELSVTRIRKAVSTGELSAVEVARAYLDRIDRHDASLKCFLTVSPEDVLDQARRLDETPSARKKPLAGVPIAIKDNICTKGLRTTCGSKSLENFVPPYDATVIERLKQAGAVILGKTNLDEFGMGSSTENSAFFKTRNPWHPERVPGGSSGGSAAAVASRQAPIALGSDTGGSIRQPAAFCGVVGVKPTYGLVSRYGLAAFGSSLDQIGPIGASVADAATVLQAIAGQDPRDSTTADRLPSNLLAEIESAPRGVRVGVPREWFSSGLSAEVEAKVMEAIDALKGLGCTIEQVSLPHTEYAIATYYVLAPAEASSNLARYDGVRYGLRATDGKDLAATYRKTRSRGLGREVKRRIMIGTFVLSSGYYDAYYKKAAQARRILCDDYARVFENCDVLVGPTAPSLPFRFGEKNSNPIEMYLSDLYTVTANLAGVPGLALPCGFSSDGLPVGLQMQASHFNERSLLRVARALETTLPPVPIPGLEEPH